MLDDYHPWHEFLTCSCRLHQLHLLLNCVLLHDNLSFRLCEPLLPKKLAVLSLVSGDTSLFFSFSMSTKATTLPTSPPLLVNSFMWRFPLPDKRRRTFCHRVLSSLSSTEKSASFMASFTLSIGCATIFAAACFRRSHSVESVADMMTKGRQLMCDSWKWVGAKILQFY